VASLPYLGVGLSYRWELNSLLARCAEGVDWLEVTPEHFMPLNADTESRLTLLARRFPIVGHSLELSVGSDGADAPGYAAAIDRCLALTSAPWHGDHLCFTRVGDAPVRLLSPVSFNEASIEVAVRNIRRVQSGLTVPFVVENITYYLANPLSDLDEAEFLRRVLIEADCGLILDLHNVVVNAHNHGFDPVAFVDALPLERVIQIHLAGGEESEGLRLDTHSSCSPEDVWSLFEHVVPRCPVRGVNFEMGSRFPVFSRLLDELSRARDILRRHGAEGA
jgi:uncharacterized protein (UPF0276 family)